MTPNCSLRIETLAKKNLVKPNTALIEVLRSDNRFRNRFTSLTQNNMENRLTLGWEWKREILKDKDCKKGLWRVLSAPKSQIVIAATFFCKGQIARKLIDWLIDCLIEAPAHGPEKNPLAASIEPQSRTDGVKVRERERERD